MKNEMKIVKFSNEDVIATSGVVSYSWAGLGDGSRYNNKLTYGDTTKQTITISSDSFAISSSGIAQITSAVRTATGNNTITITANTPWVYNGTSYTTSNLGKTTGVNVLNGVSFKYDVVGGKFVTIQ